MFNLRNKIVGFGTLCLGVFGASVGLGKAENFDWGLKKESVRIVISETPSPSEQFAAEELQTYLRKLSGEEIPIIQNNSPGNGRNIILGRHPENTDLFQGLSDPDHYIVDAGSERLRAVGGYRPPVMDSRGTEYVYDWGILYAVYQLLEDQGIRWYRPEPEGEHVPQSSVLRIVEGTRKFEPSFQLRWGVARYASAYLRTATAEESEMARLWALRNRANVTSLLEPKYGGSLRIGGGGHVYSSLIPPSMFDYHPDFFPLIDGQRTSKGQICLGNPAVQDYVSEEIIARANDNPQWFMTSVDPNDGGGWCECNLCRAMDDPEVKSGRGGGLSMSSRVAAFNNIIAKRVAKAHPNLLLYCLAYASYLEAPTKVDHLQNNLVIGLAPFAGAFSDYSKALLDPESVPNRRFMEAIKGYSKFGVKMYAREYLSHYMWPGPLPLLWVMQDRFRAYKQYNFIGVYSETHPNWGPQGMLLYMYLRLLWDLDLDLEAELEQYCHDFYGPAAEAMLRYHQVIEERGKTGPYFGSGGSHAQNLFTGKVLATLRPYAERARKQAAGKAPYEWRVESVLAGYEFARLYRRTMDLLRAQKIEEAQQAYENLVQFYDNQSVTGDIFNKGEGRPTDAKGAPRVPATFRPLRTELVKASALYDQFKNPKLLQELDEDWHFHPDPKEEGVAFGWNRSSVEDGEWTRIRSGAAWQNQGFPDFLGTAWYRRTFANPPLEPGKRLVLVFQAVDGDTTVWLNGKEVGSHELLDLEGNNRWDDPFTFDITDLVNQEEENTLAVRVKKTSGNGGIHRSVKLLQVDP